MRRLLILCLSLLSLQASAQDQVPKLAISGTVMFSVSRTPIPAAQVELARVSRGAVGPLGVSVTKQASTTTDTAGKFTFGELEPGEYQLLPALPQSSNGPGVGEPRPRRITLTTSGGSRSVELWLTKMSKVSGRVLDFEGKPAQGFRVQLGKIGWDAGLKLTDVPGSNEAAVGDDGRYTLLAPPGEDYLVVVSRPPAGTGPTSSSLLQYYYYPGVGSPDDAIRFDVRVGSELDGINITLNRTDRFRIRMTLPLPRYLPGVPEALTSYLSPGARIVDGFLHPLGRQAIRTNNYAIGLERQSDDVWLTPPIEPGDYELGLQYSTALSQALMSKKIGSLDWYALNPLATLRINVDPREDKDNDHILDIGVVPLAAKVSVAGRVIFKSGSDPKIDFTKLRFFFAGSFLGTHIVDPAADGTFEIKGVNPGLFEITPPPAQWDLPAGFYVASVTSGGDVLKDGLVIETDKRNPVEIVIADNASTVEGVVRGRNNSVVPDARVILIPPPNRRGIMTNFPVALSNESGEFVIDRVPPGDYRLLALDLAGIPDTGAFGVVTPTWQGADFLREFESRGERITLVPGARLVTQPSAVALHK